MRRAAVIIITLLLGVAVAFATYSAYSYRSAPLVKEEMTYKDITVTDGTFTAYFTCTKENRWLSEYDYTVEDGKLYIELYATAGDKKRLATGDDGYAEIKIPNVGKISEVYYRCKGEKDAKLTVNED